MSATPSHFETRSVCAIYEARKFTDIQILIINTRGAEWEDTNIFKSRTVVDRFGLKVLGAKGYIDGDFLIQGEIPKSKVKRVPLDHITAQYAAQAWKTDVKGARRYLRLGANGQKLKSADSKATNDKKRKHSEPEEEEDPEATQELTDSRESKEAEEAEETEFAEENETSEPEGAPKFLKVDANGQEGEGSQTGLISGQK